MQKIIGCLLVCLWFAACQAGSPTIGRSPSAQESILQAKLSPEQIDKANTLKRPGTKDQIKFLYDDKGQAVSWMVIYDPPQTITQVPQKSSENNYHTQNFYQFFSDKINYANVSACRVATFAQPPNISVSTYLSWYRNSVWSYGGRVNHPDPWVRDETCQGQYTAKLNGAGNLRFREERVADVQGWSYGYSLSPLDPLYYLLHSGFSTIQLEAPCASVSQGVDVTLDKTAACDGSSPDFHTSAHYNGFSGGGGGGGQMPVPTPTPEPFCQRSIQASLDQEEARLRQLELDADSLASQIGEEDFSFRTQAQFQVQGINPPYPHPYPMPTAQPSASGADFRLQGFALPSSFSSPSGTPSGGSTPTPTATPADVVSQADILTQIHLLEDLAARVQSKIEQLEQYFRQEYQKVQNDPSPDPDMVAIYSGYLDQTAQLRDTLNPVVVSVKDTKDTLAFLCTDPPPEFVEPKLSLVYANFGPDGSIVVHGRVSGDFENFDLSKIALDFNGDIDVEAPLDPQILVGDAHRFVIRIPFGSYVYTNDYRTKVVTEGLQEDADHSLKLQGIRVKLGYCETPGCFQTNQLHMHFPESELNQHKELIKKYAVNFETCKSNGFSDIYDVYTNINKSQVSNAPPPPTSDFENKYHYMLHYLRQAPLQPGSAVCIGLEMFRNSDGKSMAFVSNPKGLWQAYNSVLLLLGRQIYDISESHVDMSVSPRDIRLLLERLYSPAITADFLPSNVPANLFMLLPNAFSDKNAYFQVLQNAKVLDPDTPVRTAPFTNSSPDLANGGIFTRWPTICDDYKGRLQASGAAQKADTNKKKATMLEAVTRYHLLSLLQPGAAGPVLNLPHPKNQIWVSTAQYRPNPGNWESDNLLYQGELRSGQFGIRLLGIAENKMSNPFNAERQLKDNGQYLNNHNLSGVGFEMDELGGANPRDVKIWELKENEAPFIKLGICSGDKSNRTTVGAVRPFLDKGIVLATVPETESNVINLVNIVDQGGCP